MNITETIIEFAADQAGLEEKDVTVDSTYDDLGFDSLDAVEFIMSVEEEWNIEISDEDAEKMNTVQDVIDYVTEHI